MVNINLQGISYNISIVKKQERREMQDASKQQVPEQDFNQFIIAIKSGAIEQVEEWLNKYSLDITNRLDGQLRQPPLYFAINLPDDDTCLAMMKRLVAHKANPRYKDPFGQTIIFYACRDGKKKCVNYIESLGVSLYEEDTYGQTPLYYVANQNRLELLDKFDRPEYYNHADKLAKQTPLYYAAKKGYFDMCKALLERGCDPSHQDVHNKTAVEYARRARYHEVSQLLAAEVKRIRQAKMSTQVKEPPKPKEIKQVPKVHKKQPEPEPIAVPRSFYKIVHVNDQGETKQLTEEDVRSLVKNNPNIQPFLANPSSIPKQALEAHKETEEGQKWQKVATRILSNCCKHKGAIWFLEPVDPVKFGIMDYYDIIQHPADFGTIKRKLAHNFYYSPSHFATEMRLVWNNSYKYNGTEHEISIFAKEIQELFEKQYEQMKSV